jgi:MFS family permease
MIAEQTINDADQSAKYSSTRLSKKDASILIGNALDHYDSAIYGFLGPILAPLFFPNFEPIIQLILTYSILATSLVTRPIGSFIFGMIARKYGPLAGMSYSLIGVSISTVCIGFLPTYAGLGWIAPLLLTIIRMIKGIFAAGESTIAKMYIMENKPESEALKASFLYQSSSMLGTILASVAVTVIIATSYDDAWRFCFWLGGITGVVGYILRFYTDKSTEKQAFGSYQLGTLPSFCKNRVNILRVAFATGFGHVTGTIPFVFMNAFVPLITDITLETMMIFNTGLLVLDMFLIPFIGRILLKYDYDPVKVMTCSSLILAITIIPLFAYLPQATLGYVLFVRTWIVFWGVVFLCPMNYWFKELFTTADQYLLIGMGGALGSSVIGRFTVPLCFWLWQESEWICLPAIYLATIMAATAFIVYMARSESAIEM